MSVSLGFKEVNMLVVVGVRQVKSKGRGNDFRLASALGLKFCNKKRDVMSTLASRGYYDKPV